MPSKEPCLLLVGNPAAKEALEGIEKLVMSIYISLIEIIKL